MFSNHFIMLIEPVDQEFRKDTVGMALLSSLLPRVSVGVTQTAREQEEVSLRDQLPRWLLHSCIWDLGKNL